MYIWGVKKRTDTERYVKLIVRMITDMEKTEYLKNICDFTEVMWKKEKEGEHAGSTISEKEKAI